MISATPLEYFDYIYAVYQSTGYKRMKYRFWYYLYQSFVWAGVVHNIFMVWCIVNDRYEEEFRHYIIVSYNLFYNWGEKNVYFITSGTILLLFVLEINKFIMFELAPLVEDHIDDYFDFIQCLKKPLYITMNCIEQSLFFKSYPGMSNESIEKIALAGYVLCYLSRKIVYILGKLNKILKDQTNDYYFEQESS